MSELRRDRAVRFSYQCDGPAPTAPPSATAAIMLARARSAFSRSAPSNIALPATSAGRSSGTEKLLSLVQTPPRSGSPHAVLACVQGRDGRSGTGCCPAAPGLLSATLMPMLNSNARVATRVMATHSRRIRKPCLSADEIAASSVLPLPLYVATCGYGHSGRVRTTLPCSTRDAITAFGAWPRSTHRRMTPSMSKVSVPGPPLHSIIPGTM